jgi:hypothetical protein
LLACNLTPIPAVSHPEDVAEDKSQFLQFGGERSDSIEHGIEIMFLLGLCLLGKGLLLILFGVLVAQGLIDLLLLLEVVLEQLDVVPVLLQRLVAATRDSLHLNSGFKYNYSHCNIPIIL